MPTDLDQLLTTIEKLSAIVASLVTLVDSNGKAISALDKRLSKIEHDIDQEAMYQQEQRDIEESKR